MPGSFSRHSGGTTGEPFRRVLGREWRGVALLVRVGCFRRLFFLSAVLFFLSADLTLADSSPPSIRTTIQGTSCSLEVENIRYLLITSSKLVLLFCTEGNGDETNTNSIGYLVPVVRGARLGVLDFFPALRKRRRSPAASTALLPLHALPDAVLLLQQPLLGGELLVRLLRPPLQEMKLERNIGSAWQQYWRIHEQSPGPKGLVSGEDHNDLRGHRAPVRVGHRVWYRLQLVLATVSSAFSTPARLA